MNKEKLFSFLYTVEIYWARHLLLYIENSVNLSISPQAEGSCYATKNRYPDQSIKWLQIKEDLKKYLHYWSLGGFWVVVQYMTSANITHNITYPARLSAYLEMKQCFWRKTDFLASFKHIFLQEKHSQKFFDSKMYVCLMVNANQFFKMLIAKALKFQYFVKLKKLSC